MKPTNRTYEETVKCANCSGPLLQNWDGRFSIEIPIGTLVSESKCPNCGCKTLIQSLYK